MSLEESERQLCAVIEKSLLQGVVLIRGDTKNTVEGKECRCAIGCFGGSGDYVDIAGLYLGWNADQAVAFVCGFDIKGGSSGYSNPDHRLYDYYMLGRRLRDKYKPRSITLVDGDWQFLKEEQE